MSKLLAPLVVLAVSTMLAAGCGGGGGGSSSGGGGKTSTSATGKVDGITVGNCLNNDDFLVQPSTASVDGQSPAGVSFTLTFYKSAAAAKTAAVKKNKKTTAVVENGVVDFHGNPSPYAGAPPAKISKVELASIRQCIDTARGS